MYSTKDLFISDLTLNLDKVHFAAVFEVFQGLSKAFKRSLKEDIQLLIRAENMEKEVGMKFLFFFAFSLSLSLLVSHWSCEQAQLKKATGKKPIHTAEGVGVRPTVWKRFQSTVKDTKAQQVCVCVLFRSVDMVRSA